MAAVESGPSAGLGGERMSDIDRGWRSGLLLPAHRGVPWRAVAGGLALQVVLAFVFLRVEFLKNAFLKLNDPVADEAKIRQAGIPPN